jgi:GTP diphosphokinase / guanosine-3',5'-bis(diphosphate) 3'-diphosphatase
MMSKEDKAWDIANRVHKDQKRFNGDPYINHIHDILKVLDEMGCSNANTRTYAILHDTLEDCKPEEREKITKEMYDFDIYLPKRIELLTHDASFAYTFYITEIINSGDADVIAVKTADMIQNLCEDPKKEQRVRYRKELPRLVRALRITWN